MKSNLKPKKVLVIAGPSGAGKTVLIREILTGHLGELSRLFFFTKKNCIVIDDLNNIDLCIYIQNEYIILHYDLFRLLRKKLTLFEEDKTLEYITNNNDVTIVTIDIKAIDLTISIERRIKDMENDFCNMNLNEIMYNKLKWRKEYAIFCTTKINETEDLSNVYRLWDLYLEKKDISKKYKLIRETDNYTLISYSGFRCFKINSSLHDKSSGW